MERLEIATMLDYWQSQQIHAETALKYALEQVKYWSGRLAVANGDIQMVLKDGS